MNIYIAHYHFEEISSALNALSVHLKQKLFEETFKRVQVKCVIIGIGIAQTLIIRSRGTLFVCIRVLLLQAHFLSCDLSQKLFSTKILALGLPTQRQISPIRFARSHFLI